MNKKKSIWSGVSVLIAAVLAIVAFVRSDTQIWLLTAAFTIWAIWVTIAFVFPYIQEQETEKRRAARRAAYDAQRQSLRSLSMEEEDGFGPLLLRHVNHRISAYLKAVYPDATWEWRSPEPEKLILHGGTGGMQHSFYTVHLCFGYSVEEGRDTWTERCEGRVCAAFPFVFVQQADQLRHPVEISGEFFHQHGLYGAERIVVCLHVTYRGSPYQ